MNRRTVDSETLLRLCVTGFFLFWGWMDEALQAQVPPNIVIEAWSGQGYQPCEPSIAIHPDDPSVIVAGAILDKVYTSSDSGRTWKIDRLSSPLGVFGDPCIIASPKGDFHYFHLSDPGGKGWAGKDLLDQIVVQSSFDNGASWSEGRGIGKNPPKDQDKEWACTNAKGNRIFVTWTEFDAYDSKAPHDSTYIRFSRGNRRATRWSKAVRINDRAGNCLDNSGTAEGAVPCSGGKNTVYVAWALNDTVWFDRSTNGGKTWLKNDRAAAFISGGWNQTIPGINRANGMPVTACDQSGGKHHGRIYINFTDQRNGRDDTDVWVVYSDDQGDTWSPPIRVNDDGPGKHQFFTWMTVDQSTGYVYAVFYDRRNHNGDLTDVVLAESRDGGQTWVNTVISETPFEPTARVFFGDYNNIAAVNGVVRPIWTRCDNGRLSVVTALVNVQP